MRSISSNDKTAPEEGFGTKGIRQDGHQNLRWTRYGIYHLSKMMYIYKHLYVSYIYIIHITYGIWYLSFIYLIICIIYKLND
jgi:hypothetical protein